MLAGRGIHDYVLGLSPYSDRINGCERPIACYPANVLLLELSQVVSYARTSHP